MVQGPSRATAIMGSIQHLLIMNSNLKANNSHFWMSQKKKQYSLSVLAEFYMNQIFF